MTAAVQDMVRGSLDSLVNLDTKLAREICLKDDIVDDYNREMFIVVQEIMEQDPKSIPIVIHFLSVSRHLERIADLATNIAEDVVFMVDGEIIRHQLEDFA
ncbi:MAG: hypothetical protein HKN21_14255 [Candidatus Eisenbacteria bacterium]|uniref:PhoU domain-containing protein n=1 Tax=Eiseniibacteriota bacterium TaxID=2212470 RepID=A0A7Y2EBL4_UNCEI|nr:hypothetical protein [Candidatus Eisenbacteria bacterium]